MTHGSLYIYIYTYYIFIQTPFFDYEDQILNKSNLGDKVYCLFYYERTQLTECEPDDHIAFKIKK